MKKKFLLAGAAALVLPNTALAADPAMAMPEPEPVEYVRVCDVYGAGYFYIPGTETCLRFSGYVRQDIGAGDYLGADADGDGDGDTYFTRSRFSLRTDVRRQTELGEMRASSRINFDYDTGASPWSYQALYGKTNELYVNDAYVELGGFRVGMTDSAFSTLTDYAGNVINEWQLYYGGFQTAQIAYTYTGTGGFSATVAAESGAGSYSIDSYLPHLVAGASLTQGWGKLSSVFGYDSNVDDWAGKARLDVNVGDGFSVFAMGGYKSDGSATSYVARWEGDWALWVGGTARLSEKAKANAQVSYDDGDRLQIAANIDYTVVPGFTITPEIVYADKMQFDRGNSWNGFIRFQSSF